MICGYTPLTGDSPEPVRPLGGGFSYSGLSDPLFDTSGGIRPEVSFDELALHVYFVETGTSLRSGIHSKYPLLGVHDDEGIYLLFNGILGDRKPDGGNVLTSAVLDSLPPFDGPKVIYGESCRLGSTRLEREQIVFKQIPYDIRVG